MWLLALAVLLEVGIAGGLAYLIWQGRWIMAAIDDVNALLSAMNDATNAVAARLAALVAELAAIPPGTGLTADDVTAVKAKLQAEITTLTGLAADPNNPVPTPVVPPGNITPVLPVAAIDPATGLAKRDSAGNPLDATGKIIPVDAAGFPVDATGARIPGGTAIV
jgi:hypothetical protein